MSFLAEVAAAKRARMLARFGPAELGGPFGHPEAAPAGAAGPPAVSGPPVRPFAEALRRGSGVIAEIKRCSPSRGPLRPSLDPAALARDYEAAGASALSVLTEEEHFGGSLADLRQAREAVGLPVLRKDFLVHPMELVESREAGADAVLLIAAILDDGELRGLVGGARALGMEPLVEVHDERELDRALGCGALLIGINNRDLATLEVDLAVSERLLPRVPADRLAVVESGLRNAGDAWRFRALGARAVLVGESLVTAPDPGARLREWTDALRASAASPSHHTDSARRSAAAPPPEEPPCRA